MKLVFVASVLALLSQVLPAAVLTQYTAPSGSFAPTTVAGSVTAGNLNSTGSNRQLEAGNPFPDTVFLGVSAIGNSAAQAITNNDFFQFTVLPDTGFALNLTSLTFESTKGGSAGPRGWVLRSSIDSFGSDIDTRQIAVQTPTTQAFSVGLAGSQFQNLTAATTFRLYNYSAGGNQTGNFYDNITLNGTVDPVTGNVPEASSISLVGASIGATVFARGLRLRLRK